MKKKYLSILASAAFIVGMTLAAACGSHEGHDHGKEGHDHEKEAAHGHEGHVHEDGDEHEGEEGEKEGEAHANEVVMTPEALKSANLTIQKIEPGAFREAVKCAGVIETSRGGEREIIAPASGVVTFSNGVVDGATIGAGQALFHISSKGLEQGDAAATAQIDRNLAEKELRRAEELVKDNLISKKEYDQIRANYERAIANASSVAARNRAGMTVTSPIGGALVNVSVAPGSFVNMGDRLASVVADRRLLLRAELSQRDRNFAAQVTGANIQVPGSERIVELANFAPRVLSSRPTSDSRSHFIPIYIEFNNPGVLGQGSVAEVWLLGAVQNGVLSVPRSALVEDAGLFYVYVEEAPGVFEKVEVKRGASDGSRVQILSGLEPGSKVVTEGALKVKLAGMGSSIQGHSHNH